MSEDVFRDTLSIDTKTEEGEDYIFIALSTEGEEGREYTFIPKEQFLKVLEDSGIIPNGNIQA